jgi:copper transport protein
MTSITGLHIRRRRYLVGAGLAAAALGAMMAIGIPFPGPWAPQNIDARVNPYLPTPESLAIGARVYRASCAACHGQDGHGDGPDAAVLYPRPVDFWVHFASGHTHTDGRLFYWITNGMEGTAMPPYRKQLSEAERWHVINYLRTFTPAER